VDDAAARRVLQTGKEAFEYSGDLSQRRPAELPQRLRSMYCMAIQGTLACSK
jgi:hypothetical protein